MRDVAVDTNHGQIAKTIENHYGGTASPPPEGHPNSRTCPQCQDNTWRMTQWCLHCGADLFAIDRDQHFRRVFRRRLAVSFGLMAISGLAFYGQRYVPDGARLWVMGIGVISMIFAAAILRD